MKNRCQIVAENQEITPNDILLPMGETHGDRTHIPQAINYHINLNG